MNVIERSELQAKLGKVVLAEILGPSHFQAGHLPGAVNLPLEGLETRAAELIPTRDSEVVVYCSGPTCKNSHQAAERLERAGYSRVKVFVGGKAEWKEAGLLFEVSR